MQAPSLTHLRLCTSHILALGLQRLDDISGYFGCKTKIKPKKPGTITRISGHLSICHLRGNLGSHQHLRCCFSLHFSLFRASWSPLRTSLLLLSHSPLTANSPVFSENGHLELGFHPWLNKILALLSRIRGFSQDP